MLSCAQAGLIGLPQGFQKYQGVLLFQRYEDEPDVGEESILAGSDAVFLDVMGYEATTFPGSYAVSISNEGLPLVSVGGDLSRQEFDADLYRFMLRRWTGAVTFFVNNQAPVSTLEVTDYTFDQDEALTPIDFGATFSDFEGDTITYQITAGAVPAGTSIATDTGIWSGTPTDVENGTFTLTGFDPAGASGSVVITWAVNALPDLVAYPDVRGMDVTAAEAALNEVGLDFLYGEAVYSNSAEIDFIATQDPDPDFNSEVDPNTTVVILALSLGTPSGFGAMLMATVKRKRRGSRRKRRKFRKVRYQ